MAGDAPRNCIRLDPEPVIMAPLNGYALNGPSIVIEDDARDPWVSWRHHIERAGKDRGGVDLVAPVGTPVYAPAAGRVLHLPNNGTAGNSLQLAHDLNPGWRDVMSHLSSYMVPNGSHVAQGALIALSGRSGGVAPHLHRHLLDPNGTRRNPWDYFTPGSLVGRPGGLPRKDNEMGLVLDTTNNRDWYLWGPGGVLHVTKESHLAALRAVFAGAATFQQIKTAETYFVTLRVGYKTDLVAQ